jgi:hypothetical protein
MADSVNFDYNFNDTIIMKVKFYVFFKMYIIFSCILQFNLIIDILA